MVSGALAPGGLHPTMGERWPADHMPGRSPTGPRHALPPCVTSADWTTVVASSLVGPRRPRSDTGSRPSVRPSCVCDVPWQWHEHLFIRGTSTALRAETVRRVVYKRPSSQRAVQCAAQRQTVHRVCPAPPATDQLRFPNANSAFSLHYRQGPALSSQLLFVIHMT